MHIAFQGVFHVSITVLVCLCSSIVCPACCNLTMYHWCHACLWQILVPSCVKTCPHLNKPEFQPLNQILFVQCPCLLEPLIEPDQPKQWPSAQIDTMINVVTPWMRSLLLELTMADPVKVMLVTIVCVFNSFRIISLPRPRA